VIPVLVREGHKVTALARKPEKASVIGGPLLSGSVHGCSEVSAPVLTWAGMRRLKQWGTSYAVELQPQLRPAP
jgi:hypothetical protein